MIDSKKRSRSKDREKENSKESIQEIAKKMRDLESRLNRALKQQKEEKKKKSSRKETNEDANCGVSFVPPSDAGQGPSGIPAAMVNIAPASATLSPELPAATESGSDNSVRQSQSQESLVEESASESASPVLSLDEETLKLLGDDPEKEDSEQFSLQPDLAQRWKGWTSSGLKKDMLDELLQQYGRLGNCSLDAPKLNPEIEAALSDVTAKRDKHFVQSQKMIGSAMVALGTAITMLLENNDEGIYRLQLIENLCDAGKLLAATHYKESIARRAFISPGLSKPLRITLDGSKPYTFLYGSDLQNKIKEAKAIVKVGDDLKAKVPPKQQEKFSGKFSNFKGPPVKQQGHAPVGSRQNYQSQRCFQSRNQSNFQGKENRDQSDKRPQAKR